jgi:steroid delta-isomerase-like uncharacterized protein
MTQTEKSREIVTRYLEAINARDIDAATSLVSEGLVNHAALPEAQGRAGLRMIFEKLGKAFPDAKFTVEDVIVDGNRVVARGKMAGTNTGDLEFTRWPLKATGRRIEVGHVHVFRVEGDKIVEHWGYRDDFAMMRQLGVSGVAS